MKKQTGLTLIELMVATIIFAIMASVAVPAMKSFLDRNNLKVVGPALDKSMKLARSEAVQRTQIIRLTPATGTKDWSQGWSISLVTGPDPDEIELIRKFDALPGDSVFTSNTFDGDTPLDILPNGQAAIIGDFVFHQKGANDEDGNPSCKGQKYTYSVLLSGLISRSVAPCP